ncbi:MAG: sulfite dehydrogenase [Halieaceae bacterium]|jgi:sulfane dehydrogenase subunit SoxC|nr:sulfite dehydrogenase [Halieaceae bacterium]
MSESMSETVAAKSVSMSRRRLLGTAAAGAGASLLSMSVKGEEAVPADPTRVPGRPPSGLGNRSPFEAIERKPVFGVVSLTPLERLYGTITPADLHFERHHAGIPALDPERHELVLHGMVNKPLAFSLADLKRFPSVTRSCFIECSGNYFPTAGELSPPHLVCGLTSQSEWTGVPLATLLREAGVKAGASWILAEGSDAAVMSRSIPLEKALDDALIVYAQNGEAIRPAQGYPMRLLLPGWEGNTNVKWLRRLEVTDAPSMSRDETSKYTEPMRDGRVRQFSFDIEARSIITSPAYPQTIEPGWHEIRGIAWSGRGRISRVEVSTDGGKRWQPATLQGPVLPKAHTRFGLPWRWDGESTEILSRAVDETGYVQPTLKEIYKERGPGSGPYHFNPVTGWRVLREGELRFSPTG